jgi:hypothetical protein
VSLRDVLDLRARQRKVTRDPRDHRARRLARTHEGQAGGPSQASTEPSTSRCVLSFTTVSSDVQLWAAYPLRTPPRVGDWNSGGISRAAFHEVIEEQEGKAAQG